jgi:hypothetical protein
VQRLFLSFSSVRPFSHFRLHRFSSPPEAWQTHTTLAEETIKVTTISEKGTSSQHRFTVQRIGNITSGSSTKMAFQTWKYM